MLVCIGHFRMDSKVCQKNYSYGNDSNEAYVGGSWIFVKTWNCQTIVTTIVIYSTIRVYGRKYVIISYRCHGEEFTISGTIATNNQIYWNPISSNHYCRKRMLLTLLDYKFRTVYGYSEDTRVLLKHVMVIQKIFGDHTFKGLRRTR